MSSDLRTNDVFEDKGKLFLQLLASYVGGIFSVNILMGFFGVSDIPLYIFSEFFFSVPIFAVLCVVYFLFEKFIDRHILLFSLIATLICSVAAIYVQRKKLGPNAFPEVRAGVYQMAGVAAAVVIVSCLIFVAIRFRGSGRFNIFKRKAGRS